MTRPTEGWYKNKESTHEMGDVYFLQHNQPKDRYQFHIDIFTAKECIFSFW
jgi:hypothetical protein